tara:strand:- start:2075 stop:2323 length:249 start_codon:yes stop_codon:yes gene_type:complete
MKIDTSIIRDFLVGVDPEGAKGDKDFLLSIDLIILTLERTQKEIDTPKEPENDFDSWANELETKEQPTCSISSQEDCVACGS